MDYNIAKPSLELAHIVKYYWALESALTTRSEHIQRIVPSGLLELDFYYDDLPKSLDPSISINANTVISGQLNRFYDIKVSKKISVFSVLFRPAGLAEVLHIPISELFNQNIPLEHLFKENTSELETKLFEANTFNDRVLVFERFLFDLLKKSKKKTHVKRIDHVIHLIDQAGGAVSIEDLASAACLSRKQFERIFADYIGISPKRFIRIVRFQQAIFEKSKSKDENLTSLTYKCGYYDQSHMTNDFIKLTGMTPKEFFNDCDPYSDYFQ